MATFLDPECRFVEGAVGAAIYNLRDGNVYSLNATGKQIISRVLAKHEDFTEIERQYISKLVEMKLLCEEYITPTVDNEVKPTLKYAWLELTDMCNLKCIHCYGSFGYSPVKETLAMSIADWKETIDIIKGLGCTEIQLIGGEPLMYNGFLEILQYADRVGMKRIDIFTNGTLLNEEIIKEVKRVDASVRVSLYGHDAKIHDAITQKKGSFTALDKCLRLLKRNNIRTTIAVVLMKDNESYIQQIRQYIESIGLNYNGYDTIRTVADGCQKDYCLTDVELLKKRYNTEANFSTSKHEFALNNQWNNCWFGKFAVTVSGNILPCIFARETVVGNIKSDSREVVKDKLLGMWRITKDDVEDCCRCEYKYACHDCRPLAYGLNNEIRSKYPRCCYDPYTGEWRSVSDITKEINPK